MAERTESDHDIVGWTCRVCGSSVAIDAAEPWRCPNSTDTDRRHVLRADHRPGTARITGHESRHPLVDHDRRLAWSAAAAARGMDRSTRDQLVLDLDRSVQLVAGTGFVVTPFQRSSVLSDELGFSGRGGVWVKDETGAVGGSQKARHLVTILLHLLASESLGDLPERPPLAIASCGNAAIAASTLARAANWPIDVYVPTWMSDAFGRALDELGATVHRCERREGDPPGDPAMLRFREAVARGAVPFTVQGPENALCLDGGRSIGWEIGLQAMSADGPGRLDGAFVQVGGGAFAGCLGAGLGDLVREAKLHVVQAEGCAPFDRAVRRTTNVAAPASVWSTAMEPWADPHSLADGILDDETYDWLAVLEAVRASGGSSIVTAERNVVVAHELAVRAGFPVSPTGSAGLAGLIDSGGANAPGLGPGSVVAVVMSGVAR